ncbi:LPS-assembly protein LptD [Pelagibacterales bacterium SAG-MED19]|nr:LPS-assembly protein LptD [Pelagibacterales bacterium SAG-MED19]
MNNKSFNNGNEPRLKGNSINYDNENTEITKGIFTTCKKRNGKCPPWQLSAKKIQHNKKEQIINYKNAWLKVYDVPVIYFPKFFHPDPTVDRKSGFLIPTIKNSPNANNYLSLPYFKVLSENKDLTFTPRFYNDDQVLLQTEYRQVNAKSTHMSDLSIFQKKTEQSKSHFFYNYYKNFDFNYFEDNDINLNIEKTSNDTYLQANKIKSPLISDYDVLENSFNLNLYSDDLSIDTSLVVYENLSKGKSSDKYEYILPKINLIKTINNKTNLDGNFLLKSESIIRNYQTNIFEKININDFEFNSNPKISKLGFYNNYDFIIKNVNSDSQNSKNYQNETDHYLSNIFQFNSSLPMIKENSNLQKILKPKLSFRMSPNNTKDISKEEVRIDTNNIFNLNRLSINDTVEGGFSMSYGNDFSIFHKQKSREIFNFKLANNIRLKENTDLPKTNQIGAKTSNIFSEITINPNEYFTTTYNTSLGNNLKDITYENLETKLSVNNFVTTFDYINENNTKEKISYLKNTTQYNFDDTNSLLFATRRNKKTDLTEYYNFMYQYKNDCLAASIEYNKDYYTDRDIKPEESIFFKLTIIPFGETSSPNLKN